MEFISKTCELYNFTRNICANKLPKRYAFYGNVDLFNTVTRLQDCVIKANEYSVKTDYKIRTDLFKQALAELACINVKLVSMKTYIKEITEKQWLKFGTLLDLVERLIKGVMTKDKEILGA